MALGRADRGWSLRVSLSRSGAFVATRLGLSIVGGGARDCNPLVFSSCAQEAQEAWQSQLDDSISELSQKPLVGLSRSIGRSQSTPFDWSARGSDSFVDMRPP